MRNIPTSIRIIIGTQLAATPGFSNLATHDELDASTGPKSWLSVLFFDERFNFVSENSTQIHASVANSNNENLTLSGIKAPKNGYAYIYVSNSSDEPVYFDNFKVGHTRGRIVEEDHYYAFGLKIAGISSTKLADATGNEGHVKNNNLYNDKELFDEGGMNWYDYGFRNYDPQIGRFVQIDPLTDDYQMMSGYHYALNDPITNIDLDGLAGIPCPGMSSIAIALENIGNVAGQIAGSISSVALNIGVNAANLAGNVVSDNIKGNQQTKEVRQAQQSSVRVMDNPAGPTRYDVKQRERIHAEKVLQKKINGSWRDLGNWMQYNAVTGDLRYHAPKEALGDDLVGQAAGFYITATVPLPKLSWLGKIRSGSTNTIYRIVSNSEAADVLANGFRQAPLSTGISSYEGKLFWTDIKDAQWYRAWAGEGNQILKIKVNRQFIFENGEDVGRTFFFVSPERLRLFNSAVKSIK